MPQVLLPAANFPRSRPHPKTIVWICELGRLLAKGTPGSADPTLARGFTIHQRRAFSRDSVRKDECQQVRDVRSSLVNGLQADEPLSEGVLCQGDGGMKIQMVHDAELMELHGLDGNIQ